MIRLSGRWLLLIPPFSGPASLLQVSIPVLPLGGRPGGHRIALLPILRLELLCGLPAWAVIVQTQDDPLQVRILPQARVPVAIVSL